MKKIVFAIMAASFFTAAKAQNNVKQDSNAKQACAQQQANKCGSCDKQKAVPHKVTPEERTERMAKQLNLTADQKQAVLELNKKYADLFPNRPMKRHHPRMMAQGDSTFRKPNAEQMEAKKAEMKAKHEAKMAERKAYREELNKILTDEQKAKLQQIKQQRHDRKPHMKGQKGKAE